MSNALNSAIECMAQTLQLVAGSAVTYYRGTSSVSVTAVVGSTDISIVNEYGVQIDTEIRDYLIASDDLILDAVSAEPEEDDEIKETRGDYIYTYSVCNIGTEGCFRPSDSNSNTYRVHTKLINTEAVS